MTSAHLSAALEYANQGWLVFPVHSILPDGSCDCTPAGQVCGRGNPGKHPRTAHGLKDATMTEATIRAWWERWPGANIGLRTGASGSGLWVLDIDPAHGGEISLAALEAEHSPLPSESRVRTGSGGWHYYFDTDRDQAMRSGTALRAGIDWRADDGYVIAPPSNHHSGHAYEWELGAVPGFLPAAPQWLLDLLATRAAQPGEAGGFSAPTQEEADPALLADLQSALLFIPAEDRDTWLRIGMALKRGGEQQGAPETFYRLWAWWSQQSGKFDPQDSRRVWDSIDDRGADSVQVAAVFGMAKDAGWVNPAAARGQAAPAELPSELEILPPLKGEPMPEYLLEVDGLLGEVCRWIDDTTPVRQPVATLAAALASLGALYGRRWRTPSDIRTNLYAVVLGASGAGKDGARSRLQTLFRSAGLHKWLGGRDWASGQGMVASLREFPARVFMIDEFGDTLAAASSRGAPSHLRQVLQNLKVLYSSANGILDPAEYSSKESRDGQVPITEPHLCLLGTSTPDPFFGAISRRQLEDGLGNRFLVFPLSDSGSLNSTAEIGGPPPPGLVRLLQTHEETSRPSGNLVNMTHATVAREVPFGPGALERLEDFRTQVHRVQDSALHAGAIRALWQRVFENAAKLALIRALGRSTAAPEMTELDVAWALEVCAWCVRSLEGRLVYHLADSKFEGQVQQVKRLLVQQGELSRSKLIQAVRLAARDLDSVLAHLIEAGEVEQASVPTKGRPSTVYRVRVR